MEHDLSDPVALAAYVSAIWEARTICLYSKDVKEAASKIEAWHTDMQKLLFAMDADKEVKVP